MNANPTKYNKREFDELFERLIAQTDKVIAMNKARIADHGQELTAIPLSGQSSQVGDNGASESMTSPHEAPDFYRCAGGFAAQQHQCPLSDCDFIGTQDALEDHQLQVHDLPAASMDDGYVEEWDDSKTERERYNSITGRG